MPEDKNLNSEPKIEPKLEKPITVLQKHKEREKKIEEVLAQDLDEFYLSMGEEKRMEFKVVGEKTARTINTMIETGKVHAKKIIELIRKWLSIVPGINKFFVEQKTKIKTDKTLKLKTEVLHSRSLPRDRCQPMKSWRNLRILLKKKPEKEK